MNTYQCKDDIINEFGHNAEPINSGRCCDTCNLMVVVPRRIKEMRIKI